VILYSRQLRRILKKPLEERGKKLFSFFPSEEQSIICNNYVVLALEIIEYWHRNFGSYDKNHPGRIFSVMYDTLQRSTLYPKPEVYIDLQYNLGDGSMKKFELKKRSELLEQLPTSRKEGLPISEKKSEQNSFQTPEKKDKSPEKKAEQNSLRR